MTNAFPGLDEIEAISRKPEPLDADRARIREILQSWPAASLALLGRALSR